MIDQMLADAEKSGYLTTVDAAAVMSAATIQQARTMWIARCRTLGLVYIEVTRRSNATCLVTCNTKGLHPDIAKRARRLVKQTYREMIAILEEHGVSTAACNYRSTGEDTHSVGLVTIEKGLALVEKLKELRSPMAAVA